MLIMRVITLGLILLLSGCQYVEVQSGQLSSLITAFTSEPDALPDTRWTVNLGVILQQFSP